MIKEEIGGADVRIKAGIRGSVFLLFFISSAIDFQGSWKDKLLH